jgi:hypothetical protein
MALQNVAWALTGRGLMDCLQYYDNCLFYYVLWSIFSNTDFILKFIINGNTQECMTIKELFEGPVGDYCIARNTIKCLLLKLLLWNLKFYYHHKLTLCCKFHNSGWDLAWIMALSDLEKSQFCSGRLISYTIKAIALKLRVLIFYQRLTLCCELHNSDLIASWIIAYLYYLY